MHTLHKAVFVILRPLVQLFFHFKFGYTCEKATNLPDHFIVLANHTTDFDPLFVALGFREHMYFVASNKKSLVDAAYEDGRQTVMTDKELDEMIQELAPGRYQMK